MREMRETGYMHNHMRMYWGKKILEWSPTPEEAFDDRCCHSTTAISSTAATRTRSPMSAWIFGLHDRPWGPRPVFGTVRYMGAATLKKFDAAAYVAEVRRRLAG